MRIALRNFPHFPGNGDAPVNSRSPDQGNDRPAHRWSGPRGNASRHCLRSGDYRGPGYTNASVGMPRQILCISKDSIHLCYNPLRKVASMAGNRSSRAKGRQADQTTESPALPKELSDRLDHLAGLPQNWDSYGASPINPKVIQRVRAILREILVSGGEDVPLPFIAPSGDGGLELEWTSVSGKELMLELPPGDRPVAFLLV